MERLYFFLTVAALAVDSTPHLFHASTPTEPGSTLLVSGSGLSNASLSLCLLGGPCGALLRPVQQWDGGIKAILPPYQRAYAGNVTASFGGVSVTTPLNYPIVEWSLGAGAERDNACVTGSTLRLFGASLAWDAANGNCPAIRAAPAAPPLGISVTLVPVTGGAPLVLAQPLVSSCYRLDVAIPAAAPVGDYAVWVNNGLFPPDAPGALALPLLHVDTPAAWPATPFTLGTNCTALSACLAAAGAAGGGIVIIPPGITVAMGDGETLLLLPRVQLTGGGAGAGGSAVAWPSNAGPYSFDGFVSGPGPWAVRDLALVFPTGMGGAAAVHFAPGSVGCTIERLLVNASAPGPNASFGAGVGIGFYKHGPAGGAAGSGGGRAAHRRAAFLGATQPNNSPVPTHWAVRDSVFLQRAEDGGHACTAYWPHSDPLWALSAASGEVRGNAFLSACEGYNIDSSSRLFIADNFFEARGPVFSEGSGFSHFSYPQVQDGIYFGNNSALGNASATIRQETMSFDGGPGLFYGGVSPINGSALHFTLSYNPVQPGMGGLNFSGMGFAVQAGTGIGQLRRLVSLTVTGPKRSEVVVVAIDVPLDAPLDATSMVSINAFSGHMAFEGNRFVNGSTFQLFGAAVHVRVAGNTLVNVSEARFARQGETSVGGGIIAWGLEGGVNVQPTYYVSILNNSLTCSNGISSIGLGAPAPGTLGPTSLAHVIRGNQLTGNSSIYIVSPVAISHQGVESWVPGPWDVVSEANALLPGPCGPAGILVINATSTRYIWVN